MNSRERRFSRGWRMRYARSILGYCWRSWRRRPLAWMGTTAAVAALLSVAASVQLVTVVLQHSLAQQVRSASEIDVYLGDRSSAEQAAELRLRLLEIPGVRSVELRTKEQALSLAQHDGDLASFARGAGGNPFPASLVVRTASPDAATRVAALARSSPVADPQVPTSFSPEQGRQVVSALRALQVVSWAVSGLALGLAGLVALVLIRAEVRSRRAELSILSLLGTSRLVLRLPLLVESIAVATAAAAVSAAALALVAQRVLPSLNSALPFLELTRPGPAAVTIAWLTLVAGITVLGTGSLLVRLPR